MDDSDRPEHQCISFWLEAEQSLKDAKRPHLCEDIFNFHSDSREHSVGSLCAVAVFSICGLVPFGRTEQDVSFAERPGICLVSQNRASQPDMHPSDFTVPDGTRLT